MRTSFGPLLTVSDHHCPCGRPVDEDGACARCSLTPIPEPEPAILCAACEANNCTEPATAIDPAGEGVCQFHATHCDNGHCFDGDGICQVCDVCHCADVDRQTGYSECAVHPTTVPVQDALARLTASLCTCDKGPCPLCREIARCNGELSGGRS